MMETMVNRTEPCRACKGKGGWSDPIGAYDYGRPVYSWTRCHLCRGTGLQTVLIFDGAH